MLDELLSFDAVRQFTDGRSLSLGEDYYRAGAVSDLRVWNNRITADVQGTDRYTVTLTAKNGVLDYACSCPYHDDEGVFCKHCVAVALLYQRDHAGFRTVTVDDAAPKRRPAARATKTVTAEHLRVWLAAQSADALAALVWEHAKEDLDWRRRLFVRVAANTQRGVNIAALRKTIEGATKARAYPDAKQIKVYLKNVGEVVVTLKELLVLGESGAVGELALLASDRVIEVYGRTQSSGGELSTVISDILGVFREAVSLAPPDSAELAAHLYERQITDSYGFWKNAVQAFSDTLGAEGQQAVRRLAQAEWDAVKPLTHEANRHDSYAPRRARVADLMEEYARADGDTDALVAVRAKDLRNSARYSGIVEILRDADRAADACRWIEAAIAVFGATVRQEERGYLLEQYRKRGEMGRALAFLWKQFDAAPSVENYVSLRDFAAPLGEWDKWRTDAIALLQKRIAAPGAKPSLHAKRDTAADHLIDIYLHEKNGDAALAIAQTHGTDDTNHQRIAEAREATHPAESLDTYRRLLTKAIESGGFGAIDALLLATKRTFEQPENRAGFAALLANLKETHGRKRNFAAVLKANAL